MQIFIVVCEDRHTDDEISVHTTREGADARVEEFKAEYGDRYTWTEETWGAPVWVRYVNTEDDGPSARIEIGELEP